MGETMKIANVSVIGNQIMVENIEPITSGTVGATIDLAFSSEWEKLSKTAVFKAGNVVKDVSNVDGIVAIPWEVLEKPNRQLYIGVKGFNEEGTLVIPTVYGFINNISAGTVPSNAEAQPPTPFTIDQIQAQVDNAESMAQEVLDAYKNGELNGKDYEHSEEFSRLAEQVRADAITASSKATQAAASEQSASGSASSASSSAQQASVSSQQSQSAKVGAEAAKSGAEAAAKRAEDAANSVNDISQQVEQVKGYAQQAEAAANTATSKAQAAAGSAEEAGTDAANAAQSAEAAKGHADRSANAAGAADTSRRDAESAATRAAGSASAAAESAQTAASEADRAKREADRAAQGGQGQGGTTDHSQLTNRDAKDQHPMSAITGLETALGEKMSTAEHERFYADLLSGKDVMY